MNRSDPGRGDNEFNNILEYEGENCYIPSGNACFFPNVLTIFSRKSLAWSISNSYNHIKEDQTL